MGSAMRYSIFSVNDHHPRLPRTVPELYAQVMRHCELAETLGYDTFFCAEHHFHEYGVVPDPAVMLSALAQRTKTMRFGTMIFLLPFYNPIRLAQDTAMLDQLSRGRLEFGAGIGVLEHEFTRWNLPFYERRDMAEEALAIIRKAWTEESVTYEGKYWKFEEAFARPKPYQKPHPPIWFACHSKRSFEYAAAQNFNVSQNLDLDTVIAEKFAMWRRLWKEAGHKGPMPRTFLTREVHVAETDEQAIEEAAPYIVQAYALGIERLQRTRVGAKGTEDTPTNREILRIFEGATTGIKFWLDNGLAHIGSPETVAKQLEKAHELIGFDVYCGRHRFGEMPSHLVEKSIRLFGEKVLPALS